MIFGNSSRVSSKDFRGGFYSSKIGKQIRKMPGSLLSSSKKRTLYDTLKKRGVEGGRLTKAETRGALRELIDNKKDNISRGEALKVRKNLEEITGYHHLNPLGETARRYGKINERGKVIRDHSSTNKSKQVKLAKLKEEIDEPKLDKPQKKEGASPVLDLFSLLAKNKKKPELKLEKTIKNLNPQQMTEETKTIKKEQPRDDSDKLDPERDVSATETGFNTRKKTIYRPTGSRSGAAAGPTTGQTASQNPTSQGDVGKKPASALAQPVAPNNSSTRKNLATISVLILDRKKNAPQVNQILTDFGDIFLGRMGIPLAKGCVEGCASLIILIAEAENQRIEELVNKIGSLEGIVVKSTPLPSMGPAVTITEQHGIK